MFAWDGDDLIAQTNIAHTARSGLSAGASSTWVWTHHPATGEVLTQDVVHHTPTTGSDGGSGPDGVVPGWAQSRVDAEFYAIVADLAAAPTELVDPATGVVAGRATSTVWGRTRWSGAATDLRFAGQQYDPETGLHYNRYRYYNPDTHTYTSPDPLGIGPNPQSATAYVHNPHTWVDPLGLEYKDGISHADGSADSRSPRISKPEYFPDRHTGPGGREKFDSSGNSLDKGGFPRDANGNPIPDSQYPHTQLATAHGRKGDYPTAREWGPDGQPVRDVHWTDHGRPLNHTDPHQHPFTPNPSGGTPKHGKAEPWG